MDFESLIIGLYTSPLMKTWSSFFIAALLSVSLCHAQIQPVNTMKEVIECFKEADRDTLALFDIDMVILQPQDPAFQMANMKRYSPVIKKIMQQVPSDKRDIFLVLMSISSNAVLIDRQMSLLLKDLAKRNIAKMALTGNFTGSFAEIENMEDWKIKQLAQLEIDFSQGAPYADKIIFSELPSYRHQYSTYTNGILFVNGSVCPKGEALVAFLKKTGHSPRKVIFIDDREENLTSVEASLKQYDPSIEFKGLHYTGAKDYPSPVISEELFESRWQEIALKAQSVK